MSLFIVDIVVIVVIVHYRHCSHCNHCSNHPQCSHCSHCHHRSEVAKIKSQLMSEWISKSVSELVTKSPIELSWKIITCVCQASGLCVQEALAGNVDDTDNQENPHRLQLKRSLFVFTTYQCHILQLTAHHEAPGSEQSTPPSWRELHRPQQNASSKIWISSWVLNTKKSNTGWSKETVDWNFLPTDSKIPKSVITQWFLEN